MLNELNQLKALLASPNRFIVLAHKSPDGDAVGSAAGFYKFLLNLSCKAHVVLPDLPSDTLLPFMADTDCLYFSEHPDEVKTLIEESTVLICLDFNAPSRVGDMQLLIEEFSGVKIMIDHHPEPEAFADLMISDVTNSSTCQLIYECIELMDLTHAIDQHVARALYLGIMTDTGSFRFPSVNAKTHHILAELISTGIAHWQIHQDVYDNNRIDQLQLRGYAISEKLVLLNKEKNPIPAGYISLTKEELSRFNYKTGDTEGLVNVILSLEGIKVGVLIQEKSDGIKMSFRSKDGVFVNELAKQHFNGGGHKYAAGGISFDSMEVTLSRLLSLMEAQFKLT
jgi:bifunctional oligoribonuclease and PAP phosphatase NrnA